MNPTWFEISLTFDEDIKKCFKGTPNHWKGLLRSANSNFTLDLTDYESIKKTIFQWCIDVGFTKFQAPYQNFGRNCHAWFNIAVCMSQKLKPDSPELLVYLKIMFSFGLLDDFLEHIVEYYPNDAKSFIYEVAELLRVTLEGRYDSIDKNSTLFAKFPYLKICMEAFVDFDENSVKIIPNYRYNSRWFIRDCVQWVRGVALTISRVTRQMEFEAYLLIRSYDVGIIPATAILLFLNGIQIDVTLREDIGLDRLLSLDTQIVGCVNDLFGAIRRIKNEKGNVINYYLNIGKSLTDALDELVLVINKKMADFENAKILFRESCPDSNKEKAEEIIEVMSLLIDGHTLSYPKCEGRYGVSKINTN